MYQVNNCHQSWRIQCAFIEALALHCKLCFSPSLQNFLMLVGNITSESMTANMFCWMNGWHWMLQFRRSVGASASGKPLLWCHWTLSDTDEVCVCVCARERERERESVCVRESLCLCVCVVWACAHKYTLARSFTQVQPIFLAEYDCSICAFIGNQSSMKQTCLCETWY